MALQATTVSLNLGETLDQKDDNKVGTAGSFLDLKDWVWNKMKRLDKRPGTRQLTSAIQTNFPNPLSIGPTPIPCGSIAHRDQLLLQNKGVLYSYLENEGKWNFVGHHYPLTVETTTAASDQQSLYFPNMGRVGNVSIYVYVEQTEALVQNLRYSVFDESSKAFLSDDVIVDSNLDSANGGLGSPLVVCFASRAYLVWINSLQLTAALNIAEVNLTDGSIGPVTALKTDVKPFGITKVSNPTFAACGLDWVYTNQAGVGERAFIAYQNTVGNGVAVPLLNTGLEDGTMGTLSFGVPSARGFSLHYNAATSKLFAAYQKLNNFEVFAGVCSFTTSSFTLDASISCGTNEAFARGFTICDDPANASQVYVAWDTFVDYYVNNLRVYPAKLCYAVLSTAAVVTPKVTWGQGLLIAGKAVSDSLRQTVYIPTSQKSTLQDTLFLADLVRGKAENAAFVQAKWTYQNTFSNLSFYTPETVVSNNVMTFLSMRKARINLQGQSTPPLTNIDSTYVIDIQRNEINLVPEFSASRAFLNNGTHFSGGYLGYYDGTEFCEHGFFLNPESVEALQNSTNVRIIKNASIPQFIGGSAMLAGAAGAKYWEFSTSTANYYVWNKIAGKGVDPAIGGKIGIEVDLTGQETAWELAYKHQNALGAVIPTSEATFTAESDGSLQIFNSVTSSIINPTLTSYNEAPLTVPSAGNHQYAVVWSWVDNNGLTLRSGVSVPITINANGSQPVAVNVYVPPITNRSVISCKVELYKTKANGTTFFRTVSLQTSPNWSAFGGVSVSILDIITDAFLGNQALLYTNGGVLENFQIPACKSVALFKNRLLASGMNENQVYYSKTAVNDSPVEFSQELLVNTEQDGQQIGGHAQLDDKLVIFKERKIVYYGGDGANELGQGTSFSQPILLASDVGCENQNSIEIVPSGLFFRSKMGIQMVERKMSVSYPGIFVKDFNDFPVQRAQVLRDDKQVREIRFVLSGCDNTLVYDYMIDKWGYFSNYGGTDGCQWQGSFVHVDSLGAVRVEDKSLFIDLGSPTETYIPRLETQWLKIKNVQDFQRVWRLAVLGDLKSPHDLNFEVYYDYDETNFDSYSFSSSNISGTQPDDSVYQPEIHLKRQKCQSIKFVMTVVPVGVGTSEECLTLTDMSFKVGVKQGLNKVKAAKKL